MTASTETGTLAQDGVFDAGAGTWTSGSGITIEESLGLIAGFQFSGFSTSSRIEAGEMVVRMAPTPSQVPLTLSLYAQGDSSPSTFSSSNGPRLISQMSRTSDLLVASATVTSSGNQNVTFTLDPALTASAADMTDQWVGTLSLHLHGRSADQTAVTVEESEGGQDATLTLDIETRLFTGIDVDEETWYSAQSRADICPVTGHEGLREDWVWSPLLRRYVVPGQDDEDTDELSNPPRGRRRLINER